MDQPCRFHNCRLHVRWLLSRATWIVPQSAGGLPHDYTPPKRAPAAWCTTGAALYVHNWCSVATGAGLRGGIIGRPREGEEEKHHAGKSVRSNKWQGISTSY